MQVARRSVGAHDPVLDVEGGLVRLQFLERLVEPFAIARVDPEPQQRRERDRVVHRRDVEDAVQLRRVVIGFRVIEVDHVVAEVREFLRESQFDSLRRSRSSACLRSVMSRMKPMKRGGRASATCPTASSHGKIVPSLRWARTSRPMPMILASPVSW